MKQFQMQYDSAERYEQWLEELRRFCEAQGYEAHEKFFHIYTDSCRYGLVQPIVELLERHFPGARYAGASGHGSITHGVSSTQHVSIVATIYERPDSRVEVVQLPLTYATQEASADRLLALIQARPWVKGVEMMTTVGEVDMPRFCRRMSDLPEDIQFFGGCALATDVYDGHSDENMVFSSDAPCSGGSAVFVLWGGPALHVHSRCLTGWRRLGMPFQVTSVEKNVLKELNGIPALELYHRYLNTPKDEHFFDLAVVFPICFETDGTPYLRVTTNFLQDGSLVMGADIDHGAVGSIAYGDPVQIKKSVNESLAALQEFSPEVIHLYSCGSRQFFWGPDIDKETLPFESVAPTSGFYTGGELLRSKHDILLHNVAMVIAAMREGDAAKASRPPVHMDEEAFSRPNMINNCLTSFINKAADELKEANEKLFRMAITDGLTGLYNRSEMERQIRMALNEYHKCPTQGPAPIAVMLDLDYFKAVNDTHGHQEGDEVLRGVAGIFKQAAEREGGAVSVGRWGGEEFMFLICGMDLQRAGRFADGVRDAFSRIRFNISGRHTLSAGLAQAGPEDTADSLIGRADQGLYQAKNQGRNQSVTISVA